METEHECESGRPDVGQEQQGGRPGDGTGRVDVTGHSGVYPVSAMDGEEIELPDPVENLGTQLLKQAATRTNEVSGDGSTTATLLAQAIVTEGLKAIVAGPTP